MIPFNMPPYVGKENDYIKRAIENHKICGDGEFTKKCSAWIEEKTGTKKALLTTSCTHALEMAALLLDIKPADCPDGHFFVIFRLYQYRNKQYGTLIGNFDWPIDGSAAVSKTREKISKIARRIKEEMGL